MAVVYKVKLKMNLPVWGKSGVGAADAIEDVKRNAEMKTKEIKSPGPKR